MTRVWPSVNAVRLLLVYFAANSPLIYAVSTLNIGGLFPVSGGSVASAGKAMLPVTELAIKMVNSRADVLPGYRLQLMWNDTQCDPGHATNVLFESLYTRPPMIMLLGAACSSVTRATAQTGNLWNLLQVSYASTASDLSNKKKFPLLYNMVPPDSAHNSARIAFLKYFKWNRIATIRQNNYVFDEVMDKFQKNLINNKFELIATELFNDDPKSQVENLKEKDARIIVGMFYEDQARKVFCEAFKQGMYGEHYMWLLLDWYDNSQWWLVKDDEVDCTQEQMRKAAEGYFSIESARIVSNKQPTVSGMTSEQFLQTYVKPSKNNSDLYMPFVFDSVWTIALTLNNSMHQINTTLNRSIADFSYKDSSMAKILKQTLENLEFQGITGTVKFSNMGERTRPACIKQMQDGKSMVVGTYFPDSDKIVFSGAKVLWQGGAPPTDGKVTIYEIQYVSTPLFCVIVILASGGILLALYFLRFNIVRRNHSYIKLSSPNLNNLIILGCVFIYISVYMVAIDGKRVDTKSLAGLCMVRGFLLSIGYSLAVGGMFSKMWRAYQILNNVKPKRKIFKDKELVGVMIFLVFVDILVMSLWIGVDTPEIVTTDLQSQVRDEPHLRIIPQQQYCSSKYNTTWLYILFGYKILLLVIGCFIAWVTRKVKVHSLNDSRFVCMSIYNIVLCVIVGIPLAFLIDGHVNALVACLSFFLLLPTTVTLCLLFVPKIIKLKNKVEERRMQSLSSIRSTTVFTTDDTNINDSLDSIVQNDPDVVTGLQEEIAALKQEIRVIKDRNGEKTTPNLSVRIADPVENGREGISFTQPAPTPLKPRPQLGKRSVTCHTAQEMCVRKRRGRRRSNSFSASSLKRRSLDLGSLFSELADPVLVLKAENKQLHRKLQESRISETGKLAKVLYENTQLNRKIVELNVKSTPSDEAEKVSRLLKENSELKKQLGEVSILNSAWCDVTPRFQRKQHEERKISKDLRELQQLLNVDLGGRRPGSFGPSSASRPPPIGRSQSSSDLQCNRNGSGSSDKKTTISPLAKEAVKRFSFDGVDKRQNFYAKESRPGIALVVTDADTFSRPESPQAEINKSGSTSPSTIRRDNIDGCESEREISDIGERTNAGFSGDEDEYPIKLVDPKEDAIVNALNGTLNKLTTTKDIQMGDSSNKVLTSTNVCTSPDVKEELENSINDATMDPKCNLTLTAESVHEEPLETTNYPQKGGLGADVPNGTITRNSQGVGKQLGVTVDQHVGDPTISDRNDTPKIKTPSLCRDQISSPKPDASVSVPKSNYIIESTPQAMQSPLIITTFDAVLDKNGNLRNSEIAESKLPVNNSEMNHSLEETGVIANQDEGKMKLPDWTLELVVHDASVEGRENVGNEESARDVPAYKKKLQRKKDKKKNDQIEKTFFV